MSYRTIDQAARGKLEAIGEYRSKTFRITEG